MCGEKFSSCARVTILTGSPPRVRGEAEGTKVIYIGDRITPACAGRRHVVQWSSPSVRDHPRVCGEKQDFSAFVIPPFGSPPRVRGEAHRDHGQAVSAGITPACAGRSCTHGFASCKYVDHPRVCGEKAVQLASRAPCGGSPPRVRGEVAVLARAPPLVGITPACAGRSARRAREDAG